MAFIKKIRFDELRCLAIVRTESRSDRTERELGIDLLDIDSFNQNTCVSISRGQVTDQLRTNPNAIPISIDRLP